MEGEATTTEPPVAEQQMTEQPVTQPQVDQPPPVPMLCGDMLVEELETYLS